MIKRTTREHMLEMLEENPDWYVLDLGAGTDGWKRANVFADIENYEKNYSEKRFVQTWASETPFEDKEFDFVASTHIAEHVGDPYKFCNELVRIPKRGYIEIPTPFFDNIVEGNSNPPPHGHVWWVTFDDVNNKLVFKPRQGIVEETLIPPDTTFLIPFFRDSMITGLYWEDSIELAVEEAIFTYTAGNSDPVRRIDLSGKIVPPNIKKWKPAKTRWW